jgi:hypothetical protein
MSVSPRRAAERLSLDLQPVTKPAQPSHSRLSAERERKVCQPDFLPREGPSAFAPDRRLRRASALVYRRRSQPPPSPAKAVTGAAWTASWFGHNPPALPRRRFEGLQAPCRHSVEATCSFTSHSEIPSASNQASAPMGDICVRSRLPATTSAAYVSGSSCSTGNSDQGHPCCD